MKTVSSIKNRFWWLFVICFCLWIFWIFVPVYAQTSPTINNLKEQQKKIQQEREQVIKKNQRLKNLQIEAEQHLTGIEDNLKSTNSQIEDSEKRLKQAQESLEKLLKALVVTESNYEQRRLGTIARLRFLQRSQSSQGLAILLESENLSDFMSRRQRLKLIYQSDQKMLARLINDANLLIEQQTNVERQKI